MKSKVVLWDMDGTLVDSEHLHIQALANAMRGHGLAVPDDLYTLASGMSAENVFAWLQRDFGLIANFDAWLKVKYGNYMQTIDEVIAVPEASAVWAKLEEAGVPQAVVSNSDRLLIDANLNHLGLARARLITVGRNDVRRGKPDPECYLRAAWLLGVDPKDAIVVEDSPTGAKAGIAAGMRTFFVPSAPSALPEGVEKLENFDTLFDLCAG